MKKIKEDYLKATFLDELYNTPTSEFINNYGGFVITSFISGGRANALFTGSYLVTADTETKEGSMDNSINASYTFSKTPSSVDASIGNTNGGTIARNNNIGQFTTSVKTYGGAYGFSTFTVPKAIEDVNIDLGSWITSLNDKSTHVLIDFNERGLIPISDFISQENLRFNVNNYLGEKLPPRLLQEPRIEARWERIDHNRYGMVAVVLRTRFGDELLISNNKTIRLFDDFQGLLNFAIQEAQKKLPYYSVKVIANDIHGGVDDYFNFTKNYVNSIVDIDEGSMKKFRDVKHNMLYLISQANGRKFAYSVHDDYILDTYGIRVWVNGMQSVELTSVELEEYTIIGL